MSPIFNSAALYGLPDHALRELRSALLDALASSRYTEEQRQILRAALARIEAILHVRTAPTPPVIKPPSP